LSRGEANHPLREGGDHREEAFVKRHLSREEAMHRGMEAGVHQGRPEAICRGREEAVHRGKRLTMC